MSTRAIEASHPLSPMQQGLLVGARMGADPAANLEQLVLRLPEAVDPAALRAAWERVVRRHASLRATVRWDGGGEPVMVVHDDAPPQWEEHDWRALSPAATEGALRRFLRDDRARGADVRLSPAMRLTLLRLGAADFRLVWTFHHVFLDGESMVRVLREVFAESPPAGSAPLQGDYVQWLQARDPARSEGFWRGLLAGFTERTPLPLDRSPSAALRPRAYRRTVRALPAGVGSAVREFAARHGITPNVVVQGAWALTLARLAGEDDVVFGTVRSGRGGLPAELREVVGLTLFTVPVRARADASARVVPWLQALRAQHLEVREHEHVPLAQVQGWSEVRGGALFDSLYEYKELSIIERLRALGGAWRARELRIERQVDHALVASAWFDGHDDLRMEIGFFRDRLSVGAAERITGHWARAVEQLVLHPGRRLGELELVSPEERAQVLVEWNRTDAPSDASPVHERISARAPGAVAVRGEAGELTYEELDARANRLAHLLRARGVGPESRVGVLLERSPDLVVALLAVLRAGGAYVPLDPEYPAERLAFMLRDSGAALLLTHTPLAGILPDAPCPVLRLDDESADDHPAGPPASGVQPENLAYVIYTSGSTGTPKGVGITHAALSNHMAWMQRALPLAPEDRVLLKTPASFDASVWEFWAPLLAGATLVVARPGGERDAAYLVRTLAAEEITILQAVPTLAAALVEEPSLDACRTLRRLCCGGEALTARLCARVHERLPGAEVVNLYGPTEVTIDAAAHCVARGTGGAVPIGRPVDNTRAYVVDRRGQPVPVGAWGELLLGGAQLARGYLGRPSLTADRFIPDPFSGQPGARLYRTGDRARWRANGALEYGGRVDEQLKVRGHRIEPGEIEAVLLARPEVAEAAVVAAGEAEEKRLVAYLVARAAAAPSPDAVRAHARSALPAHMVPGDFVWLDELPRTPSGKVDRRALAARQAPDHAHVAPRTPTEEVLAAIWAEVLGRERVGVEEDFFALGGHSLLATRVVVRAQAAVGVELALRAVLERPTVALLAEHADELRRAGAGLALPPIPRHDGADAAPLSFGQERLWFLERLAPGRPTYHVPLAVRLRGALDAAALERAVEALAERHEILRTRIVERAGDVVQIADGAGLPLVVGDVVSEAALHDVMRAEMARPFDLAAGPPARARLWRLDDSEHVLQLTMHHIATDGWSGGVLLHDLGALYAAFAQDRAPELAPLPVRYSDFARWQREHLQGEHVAGQLAYWSERLDGHAALELPTDRPRPRVATGEAGMAARQLDGSLLQSLRVVERSERCTAFMVLLAAWQALLGRMSGQDDVVVGSPIAGRTRPELEGVAGFFVNTLALRGDLSGDPTFRELLSRVRETTLGAYQHQELPFERVVEALSPERDPGRNPIFQVWLGVQGEESAAKWADIVAEPLPSIGEGAKFDLSLNVVTRGEGMDLALNYATDLFDAATAEALLERYARLLEAVAVDPDRRLSQLELLSDEERERVLTVWSGAREALPAARCIHELIGEQALRTPNALAVEGAGEALTYAELEARSNRLAHLLIARGVCAETRVGVLLERTPTLLVALLAVLKAGGAYVPLDPEYPRKRLDFMLRDSGAKLVLTRGSLSGLIADAPCAVLRLDDEEAALAAQLDTPPVSVAGPENLAYVIYTSGSTGKPKGVMVPHRGPAALAEWARRAFPAPALDGVLASTSVCFDVSVFEMFAPLSCGGAVLLAPNALALPGLPSAERVTLVSTVPAAARELVRSGGLPRSVRVLGLAGEALPGDLAREVAALDDAPALYNLYGPTEDSVYSTWTSVDAGAGEPPIGRPVDGGRTYVLDAALRPVPAGAWGELFLGGAGVARGYLGRPALTADRFVPDPFSDRAGARLYRTGDRARWRTDGALEYGGRLDRQVKIRGFRIEPGEVEVLLRSHPAVADAVVVVSETAGDARMIAYTAGTPTATELRAHLAAKVPGYMVPSAFVALERLPLTPSGKVDRRALPAPDPQHSEIAYVAPRTPTEEVLAAIWAEVLGRERVGVEEDFFALGGHSLLATRVVVRAQAALGVELALRTVLERPTIAALAEHADELRRAGAGLALPPIPRHDGADAAPLSFGQERLWFLERLAPGRPTYHVPLAVRLRGALDRQALERAVEALAERHDVLRTRIVERQDDVVQVADGAGLPLVAQDVVSEAWLRSVMMDEVARPFDLAAGPPARARLWRLGGEEHVLQLTMHHIATDGWSGGVLLHDLGALYAAFAEGRAPELQPLPVRYADFARWQREHLQGEQVAGQLAYWSERLDGHAALELPTDRPRPRVASGEAGMTARQLDRSVLQSLRVVERSERCTAFMVLLAAWQALLGRMSGQDDVVVGSPIAGRTRPELEGVAGFFVNTLALRGDLSGNPTFRELLSRVRETTLGAYQHQELPFERVVEALSPERDPGRNPIFQVWLGVQGEESPAKWADIVAEPLPSVGEGAKFDLSLNVVTRDEGMKLALNYATDLFDAATAEALLERYARLLEAVAVDPDRRLSELELLSDEERERVLMEWSGAGAELPDARCIHELIGEQALRTPNALAVEGAGEALTYAELDARSSRLAHLLIARGVCAETRVGVLLERTPTLLVALLGVLKAGGAYVPLDPEYPRERLDFMLLDSGARLVLTRGSLSGLIADAPSAVLRLDDEEAALASQPDTPPVSEAGPENLAYVIYTSGSTGKPKGVMVPHRGPAALAEWARRAFPAPALDGVLASTSVCFDVSVFEMFAPLACGGAVLLAPNALALPGLRSAERVTLVSTVPAAAREMVRSGGLPRSVRVLGLAGEALPGDLAREVAALDDAPALYNLYGPTEDSVYSTWTPVDAAAGEPPIGRPVDGGRTYVLDAALRPVPAGAWGELFLGGAGVARGYLGRPSLTADRFVPDPFSDNAGARLYRTGDRARWRADGALEYGGRLDRQVKIRGFRIEPGEVEALLRSHPAVSEAVVVVSETAGNARMIAYTVGTPTATELRAHLAAKVPGYMVPSAFVALDRLPLTPSGKVDRRALPAPDLRDAEHAYVAPRTPTEEVLAAIWAEVLGRERVGVDEDFFALGGHSLLATRVVVRAQAALGVELALRTILERPTVTALAEHADELRRTGAGLAHPPIPRHEDAGAAPLSFGQERLWFLERLAPGPPTYHVPLAVRLRGALDAAALEHAVEALAERHDVLRTRIVERQDDVVQVADGAGLALAVEDVVSEAWLRSAMMDEVARPFDLAAGPPARARLWRLGGEEHVLQLTMHHIATDGWSGGVLLHDLGALYAAFAEARAPTLHPLPVRYSDFARWQREHLQGEHVAGQLAYWRGRLEGHAPLELPTDRPRPRVASGEAGTAERQLDGSLLQSLRMVERSERCTGFMVLLAAWQALLGRMSGQDDVVVGSPIAGRTRPELEGVVGFFVNTLALRCDLSGDPTFRELLARVREATLGAYQHQELPFEKLVEALAPERDPGRNPIFQVWLGVRTEESAAAWGDVVVEPLRSGGEGAKFDLSLNAVTRAEGLELALEYATDLFDAATAEALLERFARLLEAVAADPDRRLSELELLSDDERERVLTVWSGAGEALPAARCIHELVSSQAALTPHALAVDGEGEALTYAELEARSNQLAHLLRARRVGAETRVGVLLERAPTLLVALLGVLKAGGAYVPLDPEYPRERLDFMLRDSGTSILLSDSATAARVEDAPCAVLHLDRAPLDSFPATPPASDVGPENLAYVIYTSGSTGMPKGVMVPHRGPAALAEWARRAFPAPALDGVLASTSVCFDVSVFEMFAPLACGGAVLLAPNALALPGLPSAERVTLVSTVPAAARELMRLGGLPRSVRVLGLAGEALPGDLAREVAALPDAPDLYNLYGPTEDSVYSTWTPVDGNGEPPIGRPVDGGRAYVLDAALRPVPAGAWGELFLGGAGVARGYLGRPALTADRFVPDPFSVNPGARLYRTGDRARWRADGALEYGGRLDRQVKIRGFRIEPGEVEALLRSHPAVADAAVVVSETAGDARMIAYTVGAPTASELRAHLSAKVPAYMVPSAFVALERLPLTPSGKVDRRALPAPDLQHAETAYVAPRTPTEEALAEIWADVLGRERVGTADDFFDLGGHSLLAVRITARTRTKLGVELPLSLLFTARTIAAVAAALGEAEQAPVPSGIVPVSRSAMEALLARIDQLSEEEVERLYEAMAMDDGGER